MSIAQPSPDQRTHSRGRIATRFCPPVPAWGSQRTFANEFLPRLLAHLPPGLVYSSLESIPGYSGELVAARNPLCVPGMSRRLWALARYHLTFGRELRAAGAAVLFCPFNNEGVAFPRGVRQVLIVHDLVPVLFPRDYLVSRLLWATLYGLALRRAHHVICVSEATRTDLIRLLRLSPTRVSVVYNGYTPPVRVIPRAPQPRLLYVASAHSSHKNIGRLLEAFAGSSLRHTHELRVVGTPHPRTTVDLTKRALRPDLAGRVHFLSRISSDALEAEYAAAEIFVYPSLCEGFGLPLLEAMARGVPVCAARGSAVSEVGGEAAAYFDPRDPDDIRRVLEQLAADRELQATLVARGLARVGDFSWEKSAAQCAAVCLAAAIDT